MDTQTKIMIGGGIVLALLGYSWYQKKSTAGGAGAAAADGLGSGSATPAGLGQGVPPTAVPTTPQATQNAQPGPSGFPAGGPAGSGPSGGPAPTMVPVVNRQVFNPTLATAARTNFGSAAGIQQPAASAREVQMMLNQVGAVPPVPLTGVYDANTRSALASFQQRVNLAPTGFADAQTVSYLRTMAQASQLNPS